MRESVAFVFSYWQAILHHPRALLDSARAKRIETRLKENGGDIEELLYAIDGAQEDDFLMGRSQRSEGRKYDGIETILRDRAQVERLAEKIPEYRKHEPHPAMQQYRHKPLSDEEKPPVRLVK